MATEAVSLDLAARPAPHAALPLRIKLFYGLGEAGEGVKTAALETFLFFFYAQVVGLSGALTGLALFVALLFDGVVDPMVGAWSDRTRTRLGRRHPFLYAAPVPLAIALWFLFTPPALPQVGLFIWLTAFAIAARFAMTLYFVPHMALGAELSRDFAERVSVGGYRVLFGYVGRIIALALAFSVFFAQRPGFGNGQLDPAAYPGFAIAAGVLVVAFVIVSALGTQKATLALPSNTSTRPELHSGVLRTLGQAMRLPSFRALFVALLVMYLYNGVQFALALHMNTYFWQLPPEQVQLVFYGNMLGFIVGIPLARPAAARFDKKAAYMFGVAASCICSSAPTVLRLLDLAPANGSDALLPFLLTLNVASGLLGSLPVVLAAAMLADASDEYDLAYGGRAEGLFFGANAFCRKASLGLGGAFAGIVIDVIRFPAKTEPGAVPAEALVRLGVTYGPVMLAVLFAGLAIMIPYNLHRARHAEIAAALARREGGGTPI
ncbi:MFS transporter [Phenylobacterium sp.]|uniref:MFS transporter n=1 Tax=Phenylobacterium sp. TaxID=1871053 RepID=UPI0025D534A5|nr:MFS transporter [Phenylobacterium sp.]MBX3484126.1 MFS transporter [Phenylobacterium sp.]